MFNRSFILLLCVFFLSVSCVSSKEGRHLKESLFSMQKRLLALESSFTESGQQSENTSFESQKNLASTAIKLDKQETELQKIYGELESLKIGVKTGKMPGTSADDISLASQIKKLEERLEALIATQREILAMLNTLKGTPGVTRMKKKRALLKSLADVKKYFQQKKYILLVEDLPALIKKKKNAKFKLELQYFQAESHYKLGNLSEAAFLYNELLEKNELLTKMSLIYQRVADCFRHLGKRKVALIYYQELQEKYPASKEALWAKEQIAKLQ